MTSNAQSIKQRPYQENDTEIAQNIHGHYKSFEANHVSTPNTGTSPRASVFYSIFRAK